MERVGVLESSVVRSVVLCTVGPNAFPCPVAILNGVSLRPKLPEANDKDNQQLLFLSQTRFSKPIRALN